MNRRDFGKLAAGAALSSTISSAAKIDSKIAGVQIGAQTYSFRDRSFDAMVDAMKEVGLGEAELWDGHVLPKDASAAKQFRKDPPIAQIHELRTKLDNAGIDLYAFTFGFTKGFEDDEVDGGFKIAKALGVKYITSSSNVSMAKRVDALAQKYKITVAFHNHSNMKADEFARPVDWEEALKGASKYLAINLDIGHFTAAGFDPVSFLEQHHARIVTLHLKDRKANQGDNVPWGEGDTKIKEVLQVLKTKHYPIPANIEYEYNGADTVAEVKKCFAYCKAALA
jgi:sugar phosphate isomerase/epimerase